MRDLAGRFLHDETGATAIEYGLVASLIAIAIISAMSATGSGLMGVFNKVAGKL